MAQTRGGIDFDITQALKKIDKFRNNISSASEELALELSQQGARIARQALAAAETDEGIKRMRSNNGITSGRAKSGRMMNNLRALKPRRVGNNLIRAQVGWYFAWEYFKYQERGTSPYTTDPDSYNPNFNYKAAYAVGRAQRLAAAEARAKSKSKFGGSSGGGGIVGAHSLWAARSWMEKNVKSYRSNFIRNATKGMK